MLKLNVPYSEKEEAKALGAYWDTDNRTWCLPRRNYNNIEKYEKWIHTNYSYIAETPIYIAESIQECWKCHKETKVTTFAAHNINYFFENDDEDNILLEIEKMGFAFASNISFIPNDLLYLIQKKNPYYKLSYTKASGISYYNNQCHNCGSVQGDFYLHCEPEGAFFPVTDEGIENITLYKLGLKFDQLVDWEFGQMSNCDDIFKRAKKEAL